MGDAELVASALAEPSVGFAAIYDRYADRIYDYARSVLRGDADAADVMQDTFLAASQKLDQLRDPSSLRPWLYAIARSHAFRIIREKKRTQASDEVDEVVEMTAPDGRLDAAALVWSAAAGLEPADRDILDLHLRQGLDGQELADALGVSANASNVALHRVRGRLEVSVGAVLLTSTSQGECDELDAISSGELTPLVRKRVARHVQSCDTCRGRQSAMTSASKLFAATPLALAPLALRSQILGSIGTQQAQLAAESLDWTANGFPAPDPAAGLAGAAGSTSASSFFTPGAILTSAAAAVVLVVGAFFVLTRTGDDGRLQSADNTTAVSVDSVADSQVTASTPPDTAAPASSAAVVPTDNELTAGPDDPAVVPATNAPPDTSPNAPPLPPQPLPPQGEPNPDDPGVVPSTTATSTTTTTTTTTIVLNPPANTVVFDQPPAVDVVEFICSGTMSVVVDVSPSAGVTGELTWTSGATSASSDLVADPDVPGRFEADIVVSEGFVEAEVMVSGPTGSRRTALGSCIVID